MFPLHPVTSLVDIKAEHFDLSTVVTLLKMQEISKAVRQIRSGKTVGPNRTPAESYT